MISEKVRYCGYQKNLDGQICMLLALENDSEAREKLDSMKGEYVIEMKKFSEKRSLNANAYFWKLCDLIAKKLGSDKETIYLMQLRDYGVFQSIDIIEEALDYIKEIYRYVEIDHTFNADQTDSSGTHYLQKRASVRCYIGSSHYDSKEMAELINGTVADAKELGIETLPPDEIAHIIDLWKGRKDSSEK